MKSVMTIATIKSFFEGFYSLWSGSEFQRGGATAQKTQFKLCVMFLLTIFTESTDRQGHSK